jgi:hypothetical protein
MNDWLWTVSLSVIGASAYCLSITGLSNAVIAWIRDGARKACARRLELSTQLASNMCKYLLK